MSKVEYILHNLIEPAPSCVQSTSIERILEIFSQGQSDRIAVLNQQQFPVGVLQLRRLMPQFMRSCSGSQGELQNHPYIDVQQPLSEIGTHLVDPVVTIPDRLDLEQLKLYLRSQQEQVNTDCEWALVDADGKYIGLLESRRLWKFLALSSEAVRNPSQHQLFGQNPNSSPSVEPHKLDLLVQLLEKLPLPLMLQTPAGEVITQNPAWCQQIGSFSEPDAVRIEVEAILKSASPQVEGDEAAGENVDTNFPLHPYTPTPLYPSSSHCQLGKQPGMCICVWPSQSGQDRVWQFLKIPLTISEIADLPQTESIWLFLANDITEQQQMASELAAKNADLIQLNRLKDEFLACISHELRTPLTAMLGLSTLLKDQTLGQLNERQVRYARLIHENGRHLMSVVNDILDLTRMETGQLELTLEPVQIRKVCERAVKQAKAAIQPKNSSSQKSEQPTNSSTDHCFNLVIEPGLESMVVDEMRLRQMLVHLLANAFKFTELGGEIGLRVSYWSGWIAFTVWDTGIGIPEHQQHLIFQKFQQLENPLTRQFEGTGLGLVLTRALARLHGGDVSFLSKEGQGSQFTLLLPPSPPRKKAGEVGELKPPPSVPTSHSCRQLVLVVEAASKFIEDLADQLTSLGYWVAIARSGTEALEKARRLQPGVIFLNPLLPLLSGWDVLTLLKSDATTSQIPVVVTTTRAEKDQAFSHQADEFLSLPVKQQILQQVMTRFCGSPSFSWGGKSFSRQIKNENQLTILRLVTHDTSPLLEVSTSSYAQPSFPHYRVLEADDLQQAELLARIWQPDMVFIEQGVLNPLIYLQKLAQYSHLAALPIVTLDAATAQVASQVDGLSVFPCTTTTLEPSLEALFSTRQTAIGTRREHSVLVVNVAPVVDLPDKKAENAEQHSFLLTEVKTPGYAHHSHSLRSEWLQALIQYLHTAGFRGVMASSWEEVQQQIQKQNVDLILICLEESHLALSVLRVLTELEQQHNLPPVLVMERKFSHEVRQQFPHYLEADGQAPLSSYDSYKAEFSQHNLTQTASSVQTASAAKTDTFMSLETILGGVATKVLSSSLSMEELLDNIHQTLKFRK